MRDLEGSRADIDRRERQAITALSERTKAAATTRQRGTSGGFQSSSGRVSQVDAQLRSLQGAEAADIAKELHALQEQHIFNRLSKVSVGQAGIFGIGPVLVREL